MEDLVTRLETLRKQVSANNAEQVKKIDREIKKADAVLEKLRKTQAKIDAKPRRGA